MKLCLPTQVVLCMKLTLILLLVTGMQVVSAGGYAQYKVTVSFSDAPLENVLEAIAGQAKLKLWSDPRLIGNFMHVSLKMKNAEVSDALSACLKGTGLFFRISENQYLIIAKEVSVGQLAATVLKNATIDYQGVVLDEQNHPLEGASIVVKGSKIGTESDGDGRFFLKGIDPNSIIVISYIGYEMHEFSLKGRSEVRFLLSRSSSELDQTVIKGYYSTTERLNTGDVTTVKSDELERHPVTDPLLALEGQVPGLYISQASGLPGAYSNIMIMGKNSLLHGGDPLFIVDGVPFNTVSLTNPEIGGGALNGPVSYTTAPYNNEGFGLSPFNTLDPKDIESIVVLKDGDATAIYGSRGANGVVLITTKHGKAGEGRVDCDFYTGFGHLAHTVKMMNTSEYLTMRREGIANDGQTVQSTDFDLNGVWDTTRNTNWAKVLINNPAITTNANVNISGGNQMVQFSAGGGYSRQTTSYSTSFADVKAMAHLSLTSLSLGNRLRTQFQTSYTNDNNKLPNLDLAHFLTLAPDAPPLFDSSGSLNWQLYSNSPSWNNPASSLLQPVSSISNTLTGSLNLDYRIISGLHIKTNFGYTSETMDEEASTPGASQAPPNNIDPNYRQLQIGKSEFSNWIGEGDIDYTRQIKASNLNVFIGATFEGNLMNTSTVMYSGFSDDALINNPLAAPNIYNGEYDNVMYKYNSIFGRIGYNAKSRYLLNLTARRDGSSRFGEGRQFGNFGALGVAWIFTNEPFLKPLLHVLSSGKLRGSYGQTGNDQIPAYQYLSSYNSNYYSYFGVSGLSPARLPNANYSWEVVKKVEGGLEIGFLKDKLLMTAIYYRNTCGNQLVQYTLPAITGFSSVQENLPAVVENKGWEFTAKFLGVSSRYINWTSSINVTIPQNRLLSYPNLAASPYANIYEVGSSVFSRKIFRYVGVNSQTGQYSFATKSATGFPSSPQDLYVTKPITQLLFGGWQNSFSYKGIQLDVFVQFVKQRSPDGFGTGDLQMPGTFNSNEPVEILSRWKSVGDNSKYQKYSAGYDPNSDLTFTDYTRSDAVYSTNASFVRIKNISLAYQIANRLVRSMHIPSMRIYILAENVFTFTKYLGADPETLGFTTPPSKIYTFGVKLSL